MNINDNELKDKNSVLVLLVSPSIVKAHVDEPILRELFTKYLHSDYNDVTTFLNKRNIKYSMEIGNAIEDGNTIIAFTIRDVQLFGIKYY